MQTLGGGGGPDPPPPPPGRHMHFRAYRTSFRRHQVRNPQKLPRYIPDPLPHPPPISYSCRTPSPPFQNSCIRPCSGPVYFAKGGGGGKGRDILSLAKGRGYEILRVRGRCIRGLGLRPSHFLLLSCYFGAFSLYLYRQGDVRHRPL